MFHDFFLFIETGKDCIPWADLNLHWRYPLGDLTGNGCRNPKGLGNGKPMCYYEGSLDIPLPLWKWENCDIPECERDCTRDPLNTDLPYCEEFVEPNPDLQVRSFCDFCLYHFSMFHFSPQAVVSVLSRGGVGFGDKIDLVDKTILDKCVREDGKILSVDKSAVSAPAQILNMAFGGVHTPQNPIADDVG